MQDDGFFQKHQVGQHLAAIFDDLAGFIYFVKDAQLNYVAFNKRLEEVFDVDDGNKILGKSDKEFLPPHLFKAIHKDDLQVIDTGESIVNRVELIPRGNGFVDWGTTTKKPLLNQHGKVCGLIGVTRPFSQGTTSLSKNEELGSALKTIHASFI